MAGILYNKAHEHIDTGTGDYKLATSALADGIDASDEFLTDLAAGSTSQLEALTLITAVGYTAGGVKTFDIDQFTITGAASGAPHSITYVHVYRDQGGALPPLLICAFDIRPGQTGSDVSLGSGETRIIPVDQANLYIRWLKPVAV